MKLPAAARPMLPLAIGLALGAAGVSMFRASLTGPAGSPEERAATLEVELKKANNRIAALEDTDASGRRKSLRTTRDNLREIRDRLQSGQEVTPEDIFRLTQPFMRDIAPLLERMREREQQQTADRLSGEFAREFNLDAGQQDALRKYFEAKAADNAQEWTRLVSQDGTRLQDLMKAARDVRADDGLDEFMPRILTGEKLAEFQTQRMEERVGRVQNEADAKTERLHSIVTLDDTQRDQVFGIMARGSRDYDPAMKLEGIGGEIGNTPAGDRQQAMLSVLRPEQREAYESERQKRREEAAAEMQEFGLSLPPEWNLLDDFD